MRSHLPMNQCTSDELIALCDEMAALIRSGLPLEQALSNRSRSFPKRLGNRVREMAEKLESGVPLAEAIRRDPFFPPTYASIIAAGIESGDLAGPLEELARSTRVLREATNFIVHSTFYPMLLLSVLWIILAGTLFFILPNFFAFLIDYGAIGASYDWTETIRRYPLEYSGVTLGTLACIWFLYFIWYLSSRRAMLLQCRFSLLGYIPWTGSARHLLRKSVFARYLAMLVKYDVPLEQGILLAVQAVDPQARRFREKHVDPETPLNPRGENDSSSTPIDYGNSSLASLIAWARGIPSAQALYEGLDLYAEIATRHARIQLDRGKVWFPVLCTLCVAVTIASAYLATIILPYGFALYSVLRLPP